MGLSRGERADVEIVGDFPFVLVEAADLNGHGVDNAS